MIRFLFLMLFAALFASCDTGKLASAPSELEGVWIYKGYLHGIADCADEMELVTLEITRKGDVFEISGRSFINSYFSTARVNFNSPEQAGTIRFESIGSTKMGGPENLMKCETVYYQLLGNSNTVKIENQRLYLGREPRQEDSKIPETLIFEKKKI